MKHLSIIILLMLIQSFVVAGQNVNEDKLRADEVQRAVEAMSPGEKVKGVRDDLRVFEGKLVVALAEAFIIETKKKSGNESIKYKDVLEIEGKEIVLSYFPDPNQKPFADWSAVRRLQYGDSLEIDSADQRISGVLLKTSDADISLLDGNRTVVVSRDKITRVRLARREASGAERILKGAAKGAEMGKSRSEPSTTIEAAAQGAVRIGATAAGAITAAAKRWPNDRLLIYAK